MIFTIYGINEHLYTYGFIFCVMYLYTADGPYNKCTLLSNYKKFNFFKMHEPKTKQKPEGILDLYNKHYY